MLIYDSTLSNAEKTCPVEKKKLTRLVKKIRLATWKVSILPFEQHTGGNFLFARRHFYVRRPLKCFEL